MQDQDIKGETCLVCREQISFFSISECNHSHVCMYCILRLRLFYDDQRCPICTKKNDSIVIFTLSSDTDNLTYDSINQEECYKDQDFKNNKITYYDITAMEEAASLLSYKCPISHCKESVFNTLKSLIFHLGKAHKRYFCEICIKEGRKFLSEAKVFTYDSLYEHNQFGEYDEKMNNLVPIHPECIFCNKKFYNDENLMNHMKENHYECILCKQANKCIIFYNDVRSIVS